MNDLQLQVARFWLPRLVHRKYIDLAHPHTAGHFSARIEHDGTGCYFPLGSDDPDQAAARAAEIDHSIRTRGWSQGCKRFPREFTLAVFWNGNPLLCTYTTLLTSPGARNVHSPSPSRARGGAGLLRLRIVEADEVVRDALMVWAGQLKGFTCVGADAGLDQARRRRKDADLLLFNRALSHDPPFARAGVAGEAPGEFAFGIYETSDDIFISHTGVSNGYFLRRTPPAQVLEPVTRAVSAGQPTLKDLRLQAAKYFQEPIANVAEHRSAREQSALTPREEEILLRLSKGFQDKQIADALNISMWTVRNHLKNIFNKLDVHSRTQAVIKHLQK